MTTNKELPVKERNGDSGVKCLGLYIHIPFCKNKCNYCDFLSFTQHQENEQSHYTAALCREIYTAGKVYGNNYIVNTVFIGGGTPSLLKIGMIRNIFEAVKKSFKLSDNCEITIEGNPGTLNFEKLSEYRACGINRLSLGVQSFDDGCLRRLGRIHSAFEAKEACARIQAAGFKNLNLDLMFAIPSHTLAVWEDTLRQAIELCPQHISAYSLQLEEGTPFFAQFERGELEQIPDELDREMYHQTIRILGESGYAQYEISNFARPGCVCRHNLKYWSMEEYLGFGLGAHSFMESKRFCNTINLEEYLREGPLPEIYEESSERDLIAEYIFTGMRKTAGIRLSDFRAEFGKTLWDAYSDRPDTLMALKKYQKEGYLILDGDGLRFSLAGIDMSNAILAEFV